MTQGGGGVFTFTWPIQGAITSRYGPRGGGFHYGLDIGAKSGTAIRTAYPGTVEYAGWNGGYGNYVRIGHGRYGKALISTAYAHQSRIAVRTGQRVGYGQVIGYVGSTGDSTGPHLHFEVRVGGRATDPLPWLKGQYSQAPSAPPVQSSTTTPPSDWSNHVLASASGLRDFFIGLRGSANALEVVTRSPIPR